MTNYITAQSLELLDEKVTASGLRKVGGVTCDYRRAADDKHYITIYIQAVEAEAEPAERQLAELQVLRDRIKQLEEKLEPDKQQVRQRGSEYIGPGMDGIGGPMGGGRTARPRR